MGLDDDIAILAAAPVFELFDRDALRLLSFAGDRRQLEAGERLFARGEPSDGGYVVMSGTIAVESRRDGAPATLVARSGLIGRNALFRQVERPADARAVETADVMRLTPSVMSRVLREFPEVAVAVHDGIAGELRDLVQGFSRVGGRLRDLVPRER